MSEALTDLELIEIFEHDIDDSDSDIEHIEAADFTKRKRSDEDEDEITTNTTSSRTLIPSPITLTTIQALPLSENIDTVSLKSLLHHSNLSHMWQFNFMIDIPFTMSHVHPDAEPGLLAHFVTGHTASNKTKLSELRTQIAESKSKAKITVNSVYLTNPFGTHHTKMMVLGFDGLTKLQIVIHTANMIRFDWENMTQGVWISPMLQVGPLSSNSCQFKTDFLAYLSQYNLSPTNQLISCLRPFDFSSVKAVLVASAPGNHAAGSSSYNAWGLNKLRNCLQNVGGSPTDRIQAQVSSIATLGAADTYFSPVMGTALNGKPTGSTNNIPVDLVFPTVQNVRDSLNGYGSGMSIHFKHSTAPQQKQLAYLKARFFAWRAVKAGRAMAAPHIKTYMRVSNNADRVRWVLLTSANLSKQAWGTPSGKGGSNLWIQSFELGVLMYPSLYNNNQACQGPIHFIPSYKRNSLQETQSTPATEPTIKKPKLTGIGPSDTCVAIRMPYDLPLTRYSWETGDMPWSPHVAHKTADWHGNKWLLD